MRRIRLTKNLGMILLGIWLLMTGLISLFLLSFDGLPLVMAVLALAAGIMVLLGR